MGCQGGQICDFSTFAVSSVQITGQEVYGHVHNVCIQPISAIDVHNSVFQTDRLIALPTACQKRASSSPCKHVEREHSAARMDEVLIWASDGEARLGVVKRGGHLRQDAWDRVGVSGRIVHGPYHRSGF